MFIMDAGDKFFAAAEDHTASRISSFTVYPSIASRNLGMSWLFMLPVSRNIWSRAEYIMARMPSVDLGSMWNLPERREISFPNSLQMLLSFSAAFIESTGPMNAQDGRAATLFRRVL